MDSRLLRLTGDQVRCSREYLPHQARDSEEDGCYIADIPDLEACSAFGETSDEAFKEVQRARNAWVQATCKEGRPIPNRGVVQPFISWPLEAR
jgi:predicted RNase H-like HicB family nuclease